MERRTLRGDAAPSAVHREPLGEVVIVLAVRSAGLQSRPELGIAWQSLDIIEEAAPDQLAVDGHYARSRFRLKALTNALFAHVEDPHAFLPAHVARAHLANLV